MSAKQTKAGTSEVDVIKVWISGSGRIHSQRGCSGANRRSMRPMYTTREELAATWAAIVARREDPSFVICRCARHLARGDR